MAVKKSELYSSLWQSCDELRGGMDASLYKDYVLTLLFVKYVTDKYMGDRFAEIEIPAGGSFHDMIEAKGKNDIGDRMNKIIRKLADENRLNGVIDVADFDDDSKLGSGKEKVDRLTNLIAIFQNEALDFRKNRAGGDDICSSGAMPRLSSEKKSSRKKLLRVSSGFRPTSFSEQVYRPALLL